VFAGEAPLLKPGLQSLGGHAVAQHQVLNHLLSIPLVQQVIRVQLCGVGIEKAYLTRYLIDHPLENGVHGGNSP
jgi:hypothetical protein